MSPILHPVFVGDRNADLDVKSIRAFECSREGNWIVVRTKDNAAYDFRRIQWDKFRRGAIELMVSIRDDTDGKD